MNKERLLAYAKLIAQMGVHIQPGQEVFITSELDQPEFVRMLTKECYLAGASRVTVDFSDQELDLLHIANRTEEVLSTLTSYEKEKWVYMKDHLPCRIYLLSDDPDGLQGIDQGKLARANQKKMGFIKPIRQEMEDHYQWCIAAVPGLAWATKLFPQDPDPVERLWNLILDTSRVTEDPLKAWEEHNQDLQNRYTYLNDLHIKTLHYKSSNGTDFHVDLMEESLFLGGGEYTREGVFYNPNIPSEEVFTTPKAGFCEGTVVASMPLSYNGELIENFSFTFDGGKVISFKAEKGEAILKELLSMDEGASMLGECALVPYDSPIRKSGVLFYNTLFDENAACHFALGRGFNNCVRNAEQMTNEELKKKGVNDSMIHVDFMVGTKDLAITATTFDGREVPIFVDGNWAF